MTKEYHRKETNKDLFKERRRSLVENHTVDTERYTHIDLENEIGIPFVKSPDYSIANVKGYGKISLITSFFNPFSDNGFWHRSGRFFSEHLYVVDCNWMDKVATACILASLIISIVILHTAYKLDAHQGYVYNDPIDDICDTTTDPKEKAEKAKIVAEKKAILAYYNSWSTGLGMLIAKTSLVVVPGLLTFWIVFKRTSVHRKDNTAQSYLVGQKPNKVAIGQ
jgi:hypothetical protein